MSTENVLLTREQIEEMATRLKLMEARTERLSDRVSSLEDDDDGWDDDDDEDDDESHEYYEWQKLLEMQQRAPEFLAEIVQQPQVIFLDMFRKWG